VGGPEHALLTGLMNALSYQLSIGLKVISIIILRFVNLIDRICVSLIINLIQLTRVTSEHKELHEKFIYFDDSTISGVLWPLSNALCLCWHVVVPF